MTETPRPEELGPEGPSSSNDQRRLAVMVVRLLKLWQRSANDQAHLLSLEKSDTGGLERLSRSDLAGLGQKVWVHVDHLLAIHGLLRLLFPQNVYIAYRWMSIQNRAFGDSTPLALIREEGLNGLQAVRAYLNAAAH